MIFDGHRRFCINWDRRVPLLTTRIQRLTEIRNSKMRFTQVFAAFMVISAGVDALTTPQPVSSVKVNPLPVPASITWGTSGLKRVAGGLVVRTTYNQAVSDAWNRAFKA